MLQKLFKNTSRRLNKIRFDFYRHPYFDRFKLKEIKKRWDVSNLQEVEDYDKGFMRRAWVRPLETQPQQTISSFAWPLYTNPLYNREFTRFMFSFRSENSTNRNINSLMFLTGPELSGKSWLMKINLEKFQSASFSKILCHIDLAKTGCMNFETFLDLFEGEITSQLLNSCDDIFQNEPVLTAKMIHDLLLYNHDKLFFDIKLKELLENGLSGDGLLFFNDEQREKILELIAKNISRETGSTPISDSFLDICEILSFGNGSANRRNTAAALMLANFFYIQEEISTCPVENYAGLYRTGLKTSWFLLDVLNLIGGYHEMNVQGYEYPHVLVAVGIFYIEKADKILEIETAENRPVSWIEGIALKLYVNCM